MIEWLVLGVAWTALAVPTALLIGWALRESGCDYDRRRAELETRLGRPLTGAERWSLYR